MRKILVTALLFALAACATKRDWRDLEPTANPSRVIATELAFARAAQEEGQWPAFREFATDDAVMFVPEPVNAQDWLREQQHPPEALTWQPHQVWSSCDGSLAVTKGAWQRTDGATGYFTTVWERQRDDSYKWTMDQGDTLPQPLPAPEMIDAAVADCTGGADPVVTSPAPGQTRRDGRAKDGSLYWSVVVGEDGDREVLVKLWQDGEMKNVVQETVVQED